MKIKSSTKLMTWEEQEEELGERREEKEEGRLGSIYRFAGALGFSA